MNKRVLLVILLGFATILALSIGISLLLGLTVERRDAQAVELENLISNTRVPIHLARYEYMKMTREVDWLILDPVPAKTFDERHRRQQEALERGARFLDTALRHTRSPRLAAALEEFQQHHDEVVLPLAQLLMEVALTSYTEARDIYFQRYLRAQQKSFDLLGEAYELSNDEVNEFNAAASTAASRAQRYSQVLILLLCVAGTATALLVARTISRLVRAAQRAAQEIHDMAEQTFDLICSCDAEGRIVSINSACLRVFGYEASELVGTSYLNLVHPAERFAARDNEVQTKAGNPIRNQRGRFRRRDGSTLFLIWSARWVPEQQHIVCIAQDVTARTLAEQALQGSEERQRRILATSHDAFICIDAQGCVLDWNAQAEQTFGWSRAEALGQDMARLIVPERFHAQHHAGLERFVHPGESAVVNRRVELPGLHRDGREILLEISMSPIHSRGGYIYSAFLRDISERKRVEQELHRAKEAAEAATRAKSAFLANMSHEIRTPMNSVIGMAHLALMHETQPKQRDYLEKILGSGKHLLGIINDVLDLSKIEAGRLELEHTALDLDAVLQNVSNQVAGKASLKGLNFSVRVKADVPRSFNGDPLRLAQVLINLASNAVKFTQAGSVTLGIRLLETEPAHARLLFEVQDTGIGMSDAEIASLFQSFRQADSSITRRYGGTGLGLAICKRLVESMGGEIGVRSQPGSGSTFWFSLRLAKRCSPPAPASLPDDASNAQETRPALGGVHILVVEDNVFNQQVALELLEMAGATVSLAGNGEEALAQLRGHAIDCVLMDMQMPVMDGLEATRRIRADAALAGLPVIAMTANARMEDRHACEAAGMDDFITKPIAPEDLYALLNKYLGARRRITARSADRANGVIRKRNAPRRMTHLVATGQ